MKKILFTLAVATFALISCNSKDIIEERFLASATPDVVLYSIDENGIVSEAQTLVRGRKVKANYGKGVKVEKQRYYPIEITRKQYFYDKEQSLVATPKEVVKEQIIWVRTPASIITDRETSL
ncbi:MAG: hypothetical protein J6V27_06385, partial [Alistipes sp.]|nr:hypothetical protein [Alistipes sp.]